MNLPSHLEGYSVSVVTKGLGDTHSWFAGHASRDNDNVSILQSLGKTIIRRQVTLNLGRSCDVREVGRNAGRVDDIIEAKLEDIRALVGL
jgi:hypothetical protein